MKVRVKFRKYGALKFIGHLDVMHYFQKALRRADIDVKLTAGFSPHMVMTFASPLGVGLTSDSEYMDIALTTPVSSDEAVERLNRVGVEGIEVLSFRQLPEDSKNAMSIVAAADYEVRFREGYEPEDGWKEKFAEFMSRTEIMVLKETKKGQRETDIRPWVYEWHLDGEKICLQVSAGSVNNLKPELLLQAFVRQTGGELPKFALLIHRKEIYADQGTEGQRKLVSLEALGEKIERV